MQHTKSIDIILKTLQYHYGARKQGDIDRIKNIVQCESDLLELFTNHKGYELLPIFYKIIKKDDKLRAIFSEKLLLRLKKIYFRQMAHNLFLNDQLCVILHVAAQERKQVMVLKGFALSEAVFNDFALRPMADIDILVKRDDFSEIKKQVFRLGYKKIDNPKYTGPISKHPFHLQFIKIANGIPVMLELHLGLSKKQYNLDIEGIWARSQCYRFQDNKALIMEPNDLLIYLSLHAASHNFKRLMWLCDIAQLLKKYKHILNWDVIVQRANSSKTNIALYYSLALTRHLFHITLPRWNPSDLKINSPAKAYIETYIKSHVSEDNSETDKDNLRAFLTRLSLSDNKRDKFLLIKDYMQLLVFRDSDNLKQRYKIKSKVSLAIIRIIFPFIVLLRGLIAVVRTKKKTVSVG